MVSSGVRGSLSVESVFKKRGSVKVLQDVSLDVRPGEFVTLLGPSGCGKTTLLRLIGGLDAADAGRIVISGRDMTAVEANLRPVHTVFQSYALFPHLSVFENVAFGLRLQKRPEEEVRTRVSKALAAVRLEGFEKRATSEISGGQGQRVALARALILEPDILLLDEPLAALDAQLRQAMRGELVELQRSLGTTFILVTHDLEEAIECSSRIAVMREGRIAQFAEPQAIFERPASVYVARLVGMENIFEGKVVGAAPSGRGSRVDLGFAAIDLEDLDAVARAGAPQTVGLHGEHVEFGSEDERSLKGTIVETRYLGETKRYVVDVSGSRLIVNATPKGSVAPGDAVNLKVDPSAWIALAQS